MSKLITTLGRMKRVWEILRMKEYDEVMAYQRGLLAKLIACAPTSSPFYQRLYGHLPGPLVDLQQLPPVTKLELMANFDDRATSRAITRKSADAFMADKALVGEPFLGKYLICSSSGSTGNRGPFWQLRVLHAPGERAQTLS